MKIAVKPNLLPLSVTLFTTALFVIVQVVPDKPMLAAERFIKGGGWLEITVLAIYAFVVTRSISDENKAPKWRKIIWTVFCVVFFSQFFLGLAVDSRFLMSGKLHLPLPFMIMGGPIYRAQVSFMTILFLSTIVLSGPAWCSYFCYFGALDNAAANGKTDRKPIKNKWLWKYTLVALVIFFALGFRLLGFTGWETLVPALGLGFVGILIMVFYSRKRKKMVHCVAFCPIGTVVNHLKYISPFRMSIESSCTSCMRCLPTCKYDALNKQDIINRKPGLTCTLCGDCVQSCEVSAIRYHFLGLSKISSRQAFLFITISLHILCLGMGRL